MFTPISWAQFMGPLNKDWENLEDDIKANWVKLLAQGPTMDPLTWRQYQLTHIDRFKELTETLIKEYYNRIANSTRQVMQDAMTSLNNDMEENDLPPISERVVATYTQEAIDRQNYQIKLLGAYATRKHISNINAVYNIATAPANIIREETVRDNLNVWGGNVYQAVIQWSHQNVANAVPVMYNNGRVVSYRAYMDMLVRTQIQEVALDYTTTAAANMGNKFFIVSTHAGCAPDHLDIQGRVCCMNPTGNQLPLDYVITKLHRPNCRHALIPITTEQADHPQKTLQDLGIDGKEPKAQNDATYKASQQQRALERKIRFLKNRIRTNQILINRLKPSSPNYSPIYKAIQNDQIAEADAQLQIRKLLIIYPKLWREERREEPAKFTYNFRK